ncbi:LysR family transcriptional regulator [Arthrobacter sp. SW1]|uniref:LysR family transcriptional regulator n=1 Tax=Arthrobacter sp. SW1 TaxID=1920889 RepID=UPI000877B21C|nr:LysR family transcriptional regulator [Arthrobacter sp. SW1]OFI39508.1 LysR family transcriptional regulator [Arthrobacter sp. SW1]
MSERLSLEGLRYAQAVAETQSFSAAARAYGVTQPALSNGIAKLEERLGERLFERSPRGVTQTAFGSRLLPLIERALSGVDAVSAEAQRLTAPADDRSIHIGVSPLISPELVARAFEAVRELSPPRDLVLREANMGELRQGLLDSELDIVLIPSVEPLPRFEHRIIDSEPVVVLDSAAEEESPMELGDVAGKQFILVPDTCGLTTFTSQLFETQGVPWSPYPGQASSYRVLEHWADLGLGLAIIPQSKLTSADVQYRRLVEDGQDVEIFYEAVWHPQAFLAPELAALAESIANN